jgi:hypothetical protein
LLAAHHSLRLRVHHLVAFHLAEVAHVANFTETEVVVKAPLADPVSRPLLVACLILVHSVVLGVLVKIGFLHNFVVVLPYFSLLGGSVDHMIRFALNILIRLLLLTSKAGFAALKVVVLAFAAFPTSFWELKQPLVIV